MATTDPTRALSEDQAAAAAREIITRALNTADDRPVTAYRDTTPLPPHGPTPPVPQPDTRRVPQWAVGTAVASVGVGIGSVGIGCAIWLVLDGLSAISLTTVLAILAPAIAVAAVVLAVGAAAARVRGTSTETTHIYQGPVEQTVRVTAHTRGIASRTQIH